MATKLKNLKIRKVDFVDEGANPDAHIRMIKHKGGEGQPAEEDSRRGAGNIMKKLLGFIGKAAGMNQEEIDSAVDEIQKGDAVSFSEKISEVNNRKIAEEMWDIYYALQSSLCSILSDRELDSDGTLSAMQESLEEFYEVMQEAVEKWSLGKEAGIVRKSQEGVSQAELEMMKSVAERLNDSIQKAVKNTDPENKSQEKETSNRKPKGDEEEMKIDKSRMTDAERAFLESLEKRYGLENSGEAPIESTAQAEQTPDPAVAKSAVQEVKTAQETKTDEADSIYKGLHPAVAAELEGLKKFREEAEDRELAEVAKRYAIIGKKEEELVPLFKSLKSAGGTAYNDMIAVLDQAVDAVEKSGAFSEIGKSGHGGEGNSAEAKIIGIAKGYMEKDPAMDYNTAVAKAWENNPDILSEYDEEAGF